MAAELKRLVTAARAAWPHTNVFLYTNSLAGELQQIIDYCYQNKVGVGGPDVLPPPHEGTPGDRIIQGVEPGAVRDYRGQTPIAYDVQTPELCGKKGCNLPRDLYDHAVNTLGANYVFWVRMGTTRDTATEKYSWRDGILPVIRASKGKINAACPRTTKAIASLTRRGMFDTNWLDITGQVVSRRRY